MCDESRFSFDLDREVYSLNSVKKAAYRFTGNYAVRIETLPSLTRVELTPLVGASASGPNAQEFINEVLDQELREQIAKETKSVTELLLAQAFLGMALTDPDGESGDFAADPLGIRTRPEADSHSSNIGRGDNGA